MVDNNEAYAVILLRSDRKHIIIERENFEKAYALWAEFRDHWTKCLHEKKPFIVTEQQSGIITTFDPTFVYEISLQKKDLSAKNISPDNPYYKEMMEKGFTHTMKSNTNIGVNTTDLLDRGYKY